MSAFSRTRAAACNSRSVEPALFAQAATRVLFLGVLAAAVQVDALQQGVELSIGKTGSQQALLIHANYSEPISSFTLSWCFRFSPWYIKQEDDLTMAEQVAHFHLSPAGGAASKAGFKMTLEQMSYQDLDNGLAAELNDQDTDDKYALSECFILDAKAPEESAAEIVPPESTSEEMGPVLLAAIAISPATSPPQLFPLMDMVACLSKPVTAPPLVFVPPPFPPIATLTLVQTPETVEVRVETILDLATIEFSLTGPTSLLDAQITSDWELSEFNVENVSNLTQEGVDINLVVSGPGTSAMAAGSFAAVQIDASELQGEVCVEYNIKALPTSGVGEQVASGVQCLTLGTVSGRRLHSRLSHGFFINEQMYGDEREPSTGVMRRLLQDVVDPQVSFYSKEQVLPVEVVGLYGCVNIFHSQELTGCNLHPHSGDINGDLVMDIVDVVAMVMELLGSPVELEIPFNDCTRLAADGNADDIFDVLDAIGYLAIILGNECPINFFSVPCECGNTGPSFHGTPCA